MSTGSAVGLVVLGAILYGAHVNVPYVDARTLGEILMAAGVVGLLVSLAVRMHRSSMGVGSGVMMILAGAICRWGLDVHPSFVDLDGLGLILVFVGVVAVAATLAMEWQRTRSRRVVEYREPQRARSPRRF